MHEIERPVRASSHRPVVAQITSVHPAFDARIWHRTCHPLHSAGYDVRLVVPHRHDEVVDGIEIAAIEQAQSRGDRVRRVVPAVLQRTRELGADIVHFHDPELLPIAAILAREGRKVIYDVHEDVPRQIMSKAWLPPSLRPAIAMTAGWAEQFFCRDMSAIVAATPIIANRFARHHCILVRNLPDLDAMPEPGPCTSSSGPSRFVYVGSVSPIRGAFEMVRAISELGLQRDVKLDVVGQPETPQLLRELERLAGPTAQFHGRRPWPEACRFMMGASAGLAVLHPLQNYVEGLPTKLFEYMAAGIPVIASNFPGHWSDIVSRYRCGILVNPQDVGEIGNAMRWIVEHPQEAREMGTRARNAAVSEFNFSDERRRLLQLYESL